MSEFERTVLAYLEHQCLLLEAVALQGANPPVFARVQQARDTLRKALAQVKKGDT
jgi:hypothetical protein